MYAIRSYYAKETVRFRKLLEDNGAFQLMPELGTKPRVYYLPAKGKESPFEDKDRPEAEEHLNA